MENKIVPKKESDLQGASFTITEMAVSGKFEKEGKRVKDAVYKKEFQTFDQLRNVIRSLGFSMTIPLRDDDFANNKGGCDVLNQDGEIVCGLTFTATVNLNIPGLDVRKPKLLNK